MIRWNNWVAAIALLGGCVASPDIFADWPQFRGPDGQGHADASGLPIEWSETSQVDWKVPVDGLGWSSPVVNENSIFLTTAVRLEEKDDSLRLICLDKHSGGLSWEKEIFHQQGQVEIHQKNSHASPTPILDGDRVYVHFGSSGTAAVNLQGDILWTQTLKYAPMHGNGGSPALFENLLIICCDGSDTQYVVGLDKQSGQILWKTERDNNPSKGFSFGTPLIIDVHGEPQAICPASGAVFAYEPTTGQEIWHCNYGEGYSVVPRPVAGKGLVFLSSGYESARLLAIATDGHGDVTETHLKWEIKRGAPHSASPLLVGDELYFVSDSGIASCVAAATGKVHWKQRLGGDYSASPLFANGKIYFQDEQGKATVIAAGTEYQLLSENQLDPEQRTFASYAVDGNALLIRSENALYRIQNSDRVTSAAISQ